MRTNLITSVMIPTFSRDGVVGIVSALVQKSLFSKLSQSSLFLLESLRNTLF